MSNIMAGKIAMIGGGGVRTPLVAYGINAAASALGAQEFVLYDLDPDRAETMAMICRAVIAREGGSLRVSTAASIEQAVGDAGFVLHSIRVGGMGARANDERVAIDHGYPGQETTGPGGVAMALRTVPLVVEHAGLIERFAAPGAWMINFTNPAGIVTQAVSQNNGVNVVGICDTPSELVHRIAIGLGRAPIDVECDYVGLNHLGWIRRIRSGGQDVTDACLADDDYLASLYSAPLFDHAMIRALRLIPTEYLYFYYARRQALANQRKAGTTRGTEVEALNTRLLATLGALIARGEDQGALAAYIAYINNRSASYMKLEGEAGSALGDSPMSEEDPFAATSGYHRIALDVMTALCGPADTRLIVNTRNNGAVAGIAADDIIEASCRISDGTITPDLVGTLPEEVGGLVLAIKAYERAAVAAALSGDGLTARKAMLLHPAIGEWSPSLPLLRDLDWGGDITPFCAHC